MKIALVHDFLVRLGGGERVLAVMARMYPDAPIYTLAYDEKAVGHVFPRERVRVSKLQKYHVGGKRLYRYFLSKIPQIVEQWDFSGYDVVISSSNSFAHGVLTPVATRHICYYHSPMRYAWDYTHEYLEEQGYGFLKTLAVEKMLHEVRMWDLIAADRPDVVLANSEHVQKRIAKYYRRESEVLYPPVDIDRFEVRKKSEDYFLIVSQLSPYKKVDLAVHFFNKIGKKLVVIGTGPQEAYLREIAGPNVEILGYKSDNEVKEYLQYCRALIFPGEEDFGIVPIEAMACGKPVLAYGRGGTLETVVSGETGEFFQELTLESMEEGFAKLLLHEKKYDPMRIRNHSEQFAIKHFQKNLERFVKGAKK